MNPARRAVRWLTGLAHEAVAEWQRLDAPPAAAAPARDPHSTLSATAERAPAAGRSVDGYGRRVGFTRDGGR